MKTRVCLKCFVNDFRLCYTVTCNSPGYDIKRPGKYDSFV